MAAFYFINLNGITPAEREYFRNYSEVPYVFPDLLTSASTGVTSPSM